MLQFWKWLLVSNSKSKDIKEICNEFKRFQSGNDLSYKVFENFHGIKGYKKDFYEELDPGILYFSPFLRLIKDNNFLHPSSYCFPNKTFENDLFKLVKNDRVIKLIEDGYSVKTFKSYLFNSYYSKVYDDFRCFLNSYVTCNSYFTPLGSQCFSAHYETYDFVVIQLNGYKKWFLGDDEQEVLLAPGDILFVKENILHKAEPFKSNSFHLTLGLPSMVKRNAPSLSFFKKTDSDEFKDIQVTGKNSIFDISQRFSPQKVFKLLELGFLGTNIEEITLD